MGFDVFKEAKRVLIIDWLAGQGINPVKKETDRWLYYSPIRGQEKNPSFIVNLKENYFKDFGTGAAGDIIELAGIMLSKDAIAAAWAICNKTPLDYTPSQAPSKEPTPERIKILSIDTIKAPALINYIKEQRKVNLTFTQRYCKEIRYKVFKENEPDKEYFAIGFPNGAGGWELRNKFVKMAVSPKAITQIGCNASAEINVFEGFFSYLAALTHYKTPYFKNDTFILNSLSLLKKLPIDRPVNSFLDNDEAGNKGQIQLIEKFGATVIDQRHTFAPHKDFNEFLINK